MSGDGYHLPAEHVLDGTEVLSGLRLEKVAASKLVRVFADYRHPQRS
jgi:hypothetical protein